MPNLVRDLLAIHLDLAIGARTRLFNSGFKLFIAVYSCLKPNLVRVLFAIHLHLNVLIGLIGGC